MRRARRSSAGGLTGAIVLIGLVLAFTVHPFNLPIFFIALAVAIFVGALSTLNPSRIYSATFGAMWMLILALFFITHFWVWFLVGAAISALLATFMRAIIAWLLASGAFGLSPQTPAPQPQQPYYTPPPNSQPQQPYQQGYQATPTPPPETYREGEKQYYYPPQSPQSPQPSQQYDSPQSQYPQQMPPQ